MNEAILVPKPVFSLFFPLYQGKGRLPREEYLTGLWLMLT
jgi:hypothetical protein